MLTIKKSLPRWLSVTFHRGVSFHPRFSPSIQGRKCIVRFRFFFRKIVSSPLAFTKFQFLVSRVANGTTDNGKRFEVELSLFRCLILFFFLIFFSFLFPFWLHVYYRHTRSGVPWKGFVARMQSQDPQIGHMSVTQQKVPASSSKFQHLFYMDLIRIGLDLVWYFVMWTCNHDEWYD